MALLSSCAPLHLTDAPTLSSNCSGLFLPRARIQNSNKWTNWKRKKNHSLEKRRRTNGNNHAHSTSWSSCVPSLPRYREWTRPSLMVSVLLPPGFAIYLLMLKLTCCAVFHLTCTHKGANLFFPTQFGIGESTERNEWLLGIVNSVPCKFKFGSFS